MLIASSGTLRTGSVRKSFPDGVSIAIVLESLGTSTMAAHCI